jgi:glycosyltransferase involved in cell wall biosynthesis
MSEVGRPRPTEARTNVLVLISGMGLGGAETVIRHLVESIDASRFNVTIGCVKRLGPVGRELARTGGDIICLSDPEKPGTDYLTSLKLRELVRSRGFQIVHTHSTEALVDAALCRVLVPGLRVIHTFHFGNYPHLRPRLKWMERIFSKLANRLVAVGQVQRSQIKSVYGLRDDRIGMVWNGVIPRTRPPGDSGFRDRLGVGDRLIIGTVATLIEQKGLRDLIAVADQLRDRQDEVRFVIVGEGRLRAELEALRHERGLDDMVIFTGWVPSAADVAVPAFDVFFQPSLWEAMSVAVLEAMTARKPVVATRVGENTHIVDDGVDGLLVDAGDIGGMATALRRLIDDPDLRGRLGCAAAEKVARQFTVAHMTRAYEQLYLDTLGRPSR